MKTANRRKGEYKDEHHQTERNMVVAKTKIGEARNNREGRLAAKAQGTTLLLEMERKKNTANIAVRTPQLVRWEEMKESNEKEEKRNTKHSFPCRIIPDHLLSDPLSLLNLPLSILFSLVVSTPLAIFAGLTCCYPSSSFFFFPTLSTTSFL